MRIYGLGGVVNLWILCLVAPIFAGSSDLSIPEQSLRGAEDSKVSFDGKSVEELSLVSWVVAAGGRSSEAPYRLTGVLGQSQSEPMEAGRYRLDSGFLVREESIGIFADGFENGDLSNWSQVIGAARHDLGK